MKTESRKVKIVQKLGCKVGGREFEVESRR